MPWRESRFTRVLREVGVGDAAEMTLLVCVEQGHAALPGTLAALGFASRVRNYDNRRSLAAVKGRIVERIGGGGGDGDDGGGGDGYDDGYGSGGGGREGWSGAGMEAAAAAAELEQMRLRMQIAPVHELEDSSFWRQSARGVGEGQGKDATVTSSTAWAGPEALGLPSRAAGRVTFWVRWEGWSLLYRTPRRSTPPRDEGQHGGGGGGPG